MLRFGGLILKRKCTFLLLSAFSLFLCYVSSYWLLSHVLPPLSLYLAYLLPSFFCLNFCFFLFFHSFFYFIIFTYFSLLSEITCFSPSSYTSSIFPALFLSFPFSFRFFVPSLSSGFPTLSLYLYFLFYIPF